MTTQKIALSKYELLKERALNYFEILLLHWGVEYTKIGANEYDFLSPTRKDTNFGACRFNISKGIGTDFAGTAYTKTDFESIGPGFTKEDFAGFTKYGETKCGFDIIGLAQRIYNSDRYSEAAKRLEEDLDQLTDSKADIISLTTQIAIRHEKIKLQQEKLKLISSRIWHASSSIKGTIAEQYLNSRKIYPDDDVSCAKYSRKIYNKELSCYIPAILFKVSDAPDSELKAIHRIWIAKDGSRKARLEENKKALGSIKGGGIWFGQPCEKLYVCEGPEEALSIKYGLKRQFVVSTVYATNYDALTIPDYVTHVMLIPDNDTAGKTAAAKAYKAYKDQGKNVKILL